MVMVSTRVDVNFKDASKERDNATGLTIPRPPRQTRRARRFLSTFEQGGRPDVVVWPPLRDVIGQQYLEAL